MVIAVLVRFSRDYIGLDQPLHPHTSRLQVRECLLSIYGALRVGKEQALSVKAELTIVLRFFHFDYTLSIKVAYLLTVS